MIDEYFDNLAVLFGSILTNIAEDSTIKLIEISLPYISILNKLRKVVKKNIKIEDLQYKNDLVTIKKFILNKIKGFREGKYDALKIGLTEELNEIENYSNEEELKINYFFTQIKKRQFEVSLNFAEFVAFGFESSKNNFKDDIICRIKFPRINFQIQVLKDTIYARIFNLEMEWSRLEKWKKIINSIIQVILTEFDNRISILEPIIKQILKEKKSLFSDNRLGHLGSFNQGGQGSNNLDKIINNNVKGNVNNGDKKKSVVEQGEDGFHSNMTSMVDELNDSIKADLEDMKNN